MELTWEGKYNSNGKKVAPLRIVIPFQTVETVNESTADRERNLSLFGGGSVLGVGHIAGADRPIRSWGRGCRREWTRVRYT